MPVWWGDCSDVTETRNLYVRVQHTCAIRMCSEGNSGAARARPSARPSPKRERERERMGLWLELRVDA
jgi:hypothetical protein